MVHYRSVVCICFLESRDVTMARQNKKRPLSEADTPQSILPGGQVATEQKQGLSLLQL